MLGLLEFACTSAQVTYKQKEKRVLLTIEFATNKGKWQA